MPIAMGNERYRCGSQKNGQNLHFRKDLQSESGGRVDDLQTCDLHLGGSEKERRPQRLAMSEARSGASYAGDRYNDGFLKGWRDGKHQTSGKDQAGCGGLE